MGPILLQADDRGGPRGRGGSLRARSSPHQGRVRLAYRLAEGAHWWEGTEIWFEPYFPHGQVTCSACG